MVAITGLYLDSSRSIGENYSNYSPVFPNPQGLDSITFSRKMPSKFGAKLSCSASPPKKNFEKGV